MMPDPTEAPADASATPPADGAPDAAAPSGGEPAPTAEPAAAGDPAVGEDAGAEAEAVEPAAEGSPEPLGPAEGDPVLVHTRNPINGLTENHGTIYKVVNDVSGQAVVHVPLYDGGTREVVAEAKYVDEFTPWYEPMTEPEGSAEAIPDAETSDPVEAPPA